ncbi:MAG: hypothetical protein HFI78_15145 [Lachnospiraceae bacterium]|jgi:hypothetical protein|nr:hypothetical protein [Lachnospiraceae bacterium]
MRNGELEEILEEYKENDSRCVLLSFVVGVCVFTLKKTVLKNKVFLKDV